MKKIVAILLSICFLVTFSACGTTTAAPSKQASAYKIVCTTYPIYSWMQSLLPDFTDVELTLLQDSSADLHNFQPTSRDILTLSQANLFVYIGGTSDGWVADAIGSAKNDRLVTVNLMEVLGERALTEELKEGMVDAHQEHNHEEEHDHEEEHNHEEEHGHEHELFDEHIWLSLRNAGYLVSHLAGVLTAQNVAWADKIAANEKSFVSALETLDQKYTEALSNAPNKTLLFGDRFPFRYLTEDYDLEYYAAFSGCSAETEVGFDTVVFLAQQADLLGLSYILVTEGSDQKLAETIRDNTKTKNQTILPLNAMQSGGETLGYLAIMEQNLEILNTVLLQ